VEYWQRILQRFTVRCQNAWKTTGHDSEDPWHALRHVRSSLLDNSERLKAACSAGIEARIRDSCIALLQVYAAYRTQANLTWLGLPPEFTQTSNDIPRRVAERNDVSVTERIAAALIDVTDMYRHEIEPEAVIGEQCQDHALVLVMGPGLRRAYWQGTLIDQDWTNQTMPWDLLCTLAEHAKTERGVDAMVSQEGDRGGSLKDRRHRLKNLLPADLNERIQPAGRGTYRLALAAHEICVLQYEDNERLVEATPSLVPSR
jgi:hypothetical protein